MRGGRNSWQHVRALLLLVVVVAIFAVAFFAPQPGVRQGLCRGGPVGGVRAEKRHDELLGRVADLKGKQKQERQ